MRSAAGFTLVELIAVILIAGILAAIAAPRFLSSNTFAGRGYQDEVAGFLRYAQKLAIARHATLYVIADNSAGLTLCASTTSPCPSASRLPGPDGTMPYQAPVPDGVTLSATTIAFDNLGRPLCPGSLCAGNTSYTITGDTALTVTVERETGYVH